MLWEMLTGRRLFGGDTVSDTLAAVLTREPDLSDLPAGTPRMLQWVLERCLERDPTRRLHDIADARIVLDDLPGPGDAEASGPDRDARPVVSTRVHLAWLMALVGACVMTVWLARSGGAPGAGSGDPAHLAIHLAANQQLTTRGNSTLAFSPDGETLVFPGTEDGRVSLFRRRLSDPVATAIPGTANGQAPFFSPDGAWIGFTAGGRLQKVAVDGGRPFELAAIQGSGGATWLSDETIVYAPVYSDGLFRVSADGGTPERLTTPDRAAGELGHWWPDPLPGEAQVLFTAFRTPVDESRVGVVDLDTREITWLVDGGFFGRWVPTGHLVYARGQRVFAMPFDPATLSAAGPAVAVLDDVRVAETGGYAMAAVSSRGTLAYATESLRSPLGELADTEFDPVWSADSQELFYVVDSPPFELHRIRAGSPDSGRPIWDEPAELDMTAIAVSPDGRTLAFTVAEPDTGDNIYTRLIDGSEPRRPFRATRAAENWPTFSPDGRWIAYESDESGRPEIYVDPFPGPGDHVQITSDGGTSPVWSKNGELFFRRADDTWSVATRTGDRFEFGTPTRLHTYPIVPNIDEGRAYDVTADGRRLLAVTIPDADRPRQIEVVTGWMAGLVRLAPPRR